MEKEPYENNVYLLPDFDEGVPSQQIHFYKLNKDGSHENGTTLEAMLDVCIQRLTDLNNRFQCKENEEALTGMRAALGALNRRTADRKARGVEGKHEK